MSELCEQACPLYFSCQGGLDTTAVERASLLKECESLEKAAKHGQNAETYNAYAILSGQRTAEEDEQFREMLAQDPNFLTPNYDEGFAQINKGITANNQAADKVAEAYTALMADIDVCQGPTLGVFRSLVHRIRSRIRYRTTRLEKKYPVIAKNYDEQIEVDLLSDLMDYGKCTNPAAKKVAEILPTFDWDV